MNLVNFMRRMFATHNTSKVKFYRFICDCDDVVIGINSKCEIQRGLNLSLNLNSVKNASVDSRAEAIVGER